jgi:aspartate kinase
LEDIASELLELKYVMKFGNSSLADPQAISRAARILAEYQMKGHKLVVVVSALPKVTDELVSISEKAVEGNIEIINEFVERQTKRHISAARDCIHDQDILRKVVDELEEISLEMRGILTSIARLRELTPRSKDFVLSFGERLAAPIVCGAAAETGLKSEWLTGNDAGITTDDNFGEANPLMDITVRKVKAKLEPMLDEGKLPIVTGYGAANPHGVTTTLGRGGSDYTATLIGASLDADEVMIWKDVEGLMTADPKIEPNARLLPRISYAEASEMAYFGAKAIHPRALQPVMDKEIPVRIRSSFDPTIEGTLVEGDRKVKTGAIVKAVTLVNSVAMISVSGAGMVGLPGVAAKVFRVLGDAGINILMISQGSSEAGISFAVPREKLQQAKNTLGLGLIGTEFTRNLLSEDDVCIVAAVGAGMKGAPGVAARVFGAVAAKSVNVRMIAQGSSELNISFLVAEKDGPKTIQALHEEFKLGENL